MKAINKLFLKNKMKRVINIMEILNKEDRHNTPEETFAVFGKPTCTLHQAIDNLKTKTL